MDELVAGFESGVIPMGTELFLVDRGGDHGIRIVYEGVSLDYFDHDALAKMIVSYTEKLKRVEDQGDRPLLEILMPGDER